MNWIKKLFKPKEPEIYSITNGERGEDGFADLYINGKKTNTRILLFDKEQIERLQKIGEENNKNN